MKITYKLSLRLKGSTTILAEGFGPGEFVSQEVTYNIPDDTSSTTVAIALNRSSRQLIEDTVETVITPVDDYEK